MVTRRHRCTPRGVRSQNVTCRGNDDLPTTPSATLWDLTPGSCSVIVNADDFGRCEAVNVAVAQAHDRGVLSSASLLVTGPAANEAAAIARDRPQLGVGLHLALSELPALTGIDLPASHGAAYAWLLAGRAPVGALRGELEAQLDAALATGLAIDHVDGHGHVHIVPPVIELLAPLCLERGIAAIRWPVEPPAAPAGSLAGRLRRRLLARLAARAEPCATGFARPAACFGIACAGALTTARWHRLITLLPAGCSEVCCHPAAEDGVYPAYQGRAELQALCEPELAGRLPPRVSFGRLPDQGPAGDS